MKTPVLQTFEQWRKTNYGLASIAVVELVIAYLIGSRALDTGSFWEYFLSLLALLGALQHVARLTKKLFRHGQQTTKA